MQLFHWPLVFTPAFSYIPLALINPIAMKNTPVIFFICLMLVLQASAQTPTKKAGTQPKSGKQNDVEAIKKLIELESKAYFNVDYQTWMESWIHTPSAYWSYADTTGITSFEGWKAIEIGFTDYFVTTKPANIRIEREWQEIKVYGNGAYARFKQRLITNGVEGPEQVEIRVLEKDKDMWKILLVGVLKKAT
jgi:hypothetical protein